MLERDGHDTAQASALAFLLPNEATLYEAVFVILSGLRVVPRSPG